jgi:prepilin-type processing-associated H-X9-DG protein
MLLPALAQAKNAAKLTSCLANMKNNGQFLIMYAADNGREYPRFTDVGGGRWHLKGLLFDRRSLSQEVFGELDEQFSCALNPMPGSIDNATSTNIWGSFEIYAGTYLDQATASSAMFRMTDPASYAGRDFSVLMGDHFRTASTAGAVRTAHPATALTEIRTFDSSKLIASQGGIGYDQLTRNFVFMDGHAKTYRNINGNGSTLSDSRFQEISQMVNVAMAGQYRCWVPSD